MSYKTKPDREKLYEYFSILCKHLVRAGLSWNYTDTYETGFWADEDTGPGEGNFYVFYAGYDFENGEHARFSFTLEDNDSFESFGELSLMFCLSSVKSTKREIYTEPNEKQIKDMVTRAANWLRENRILIR